ncbi:hypothetical protein HDK64DRAFT_275999 [Phyllosticta capitalensis]
MIVEKVFLVLREISCWRLPGTTIAKRHRGLMPREEFSRRDRCVLAFDQDQNAIAALTGPIARLLGPAGFKVEEVSVRIKQETQLHKYIIQKGWGANFKNGGIKQPLELLVFKATHLKNPKRVYAIAPTGVRFGWLFTTMEWDDFMANYTTEQLYTQSLGITRLDLDIIALENKGEAEIATLPSSVVKQLLGREARLELRKVLNCFCERRSYLLNPERMLDDHAQVGPYVEREMEAWMARWKDE